MKFIRWFYNFGQYCITISQAITLFESFNLKNSYGKLICTKCRLEISNKIEIQKLVLQNDAFECLFDPESICCKEDYGRQRY